MRQFGEQFRAPRVISPERQDDQPEHGTGSEPEYHEGYQQGIQADALHIQEPPDIGDTAEAAAVVQLLGSGQARSRAEAIYNAATKAADWYRRQWTLLSSKELGAPLRAEGIDTGRADDLQSSLSQAIDNFIEIVRTDMPRT